MDVIKWMMSIGNGCGAVWMERSCLSHLRNGGAPSIVCNISLSGPRPHYHRLMELHQVLSHLIPENNSNIWNKQISHAGKDELKSKWGIWAATPNYKKKFHFLKTTLKPLMKESPTLGFKTF